MTPNVVLRFDAKKGVIIVLVLYKTGEPNISIKVQGFKRCTEKLLQFLYILRGLCNSLIKKMISVEFL